MLLLSRLIRSAERVSASNGLAAQAAGESSKVLQGFKELQIFQRSLPLKPFSTSPARASNLGPSASQHVSLAGHLLVLNASLWSMSMELTEAEVFLHRRALPVPAKYEQE